jgi:hypothetical protein
MRRIISPWSVWDTTGSLPRPDTPNVIHRASRARSACAVPARVWCQRCIAPAGTVDLRSAGRHARIRADHQVFRALQVALLATGAQPQVRPPPNVTTGARHRWLHLPGFHSIAPVISDHGGTRRAHARAAVPRRALQDRQGRCVRLWLHVTKGSSHGHGIQQVLP